MHEPPLQTMLLPQVNPLVASPVDMHTELPVAHDVVPTLHVIPFGVHARFCGQSTQAPWLQTLSVPHTVPALTATIVSLQVGVPPAQLSLPRWQVLTGEQSAPSTQSVQAPSL